MLFCPCSDQEKINQLIELLFRIETGFVGSVMSHMAQANFKGAVASINEKHTQPWTDLCRVRSSLGAAPPCYCTCTQILSYCSVRFYYFLANTDSSRPSSLPPPPSFFPPLVHLPLGGWH